MVKIGYQKPYPWSHTGPRPTTTMERFLTRPASPVSISQEDPFEHIHVLMAKSFSQTISPVLQTYSSQSLLTPEMLDEKLQTLLLQLTRNISQVVGKLSQQLRGEIDQIGECTDMLEHKFDDMIQYMQFLEEENSSLEHSVSQLQLHQEDLEKRERR